MHMLLGNGKMAKKATNIMLYCDENKLKTYSTRVHLQTERKPYPPRASVNRSSVYNYTCYSSTHTNYLSGA